MVALRLVWRDAALPLGTLAISADPVNWLRRTGAATHRWKKRFFWANDAAKHTQVDGRALVTRALRKPLEGRLRQLQGGDDDGPSAVIRSAEHR